MALRRRQQHRHHIPQHKHHHQASALRSLLVSSGTSLLLLLLTHETAQASTEYYPERIHHSVRVTEEHYRYNAQQDDVTVVTIHNEVERDTDGDYVLAGSCATGRFGAAEHWKIWFVHYVEDDEQVHRTHASALEPVVVYVNDARQVQTRDPPCVAIVDKVRHYLNLKGYDRTSVDVETLVDYRGHVVSSHPAKPRWVVMGGMTLPQAFRDDQDDSQQETHSSSRSSEAQRGSRPPRALLAGHAFAFASALDSLDAIAARDSLPIVAQELRKPYASEFSSSGDDDFEELKRDHMELLLQDERELLSDDVTAVEASWSSSFSLYDWELLRNNTPAEDRRALADGWTSMAKLWLATSGNVSMSVNCLRRAVGWHPGFVPAYLALSELLVAHAHDPNASCQAMEKMLESVDAAEFRAASGLDMSRVLTTHFPHCSVIIRMANLWETHALFRYVVTASVIISFLHGFCVALYFFHDRLDALCCCCCRRWRSQKRGSSGEHDAASSSRRKPKRE